MLDAYAKQLHQCLQWNPIYGVEGKEKQKFVEALTDIAALPLDSVSMEIRRLLIVFSVETTENNHPSYFHNLITALSARDIQIKCKAAMAVGSLCISRVAGQQLLDQYGEQMLKSLTKMATRKNQWVQGDAFYVLGWMVVIADEAMLTSILQLLPTVVKYLHRNVQLSLGTENDGEESRLSTSALASSEEASNFRVYALVLLLNFSQRRVDAFVDHLENVLLMFKDLVVKLLEPISTTAVDDINSSRCPSFFDAFEYAEVLKLVITLLSVLSDQLESAAPQLLELKMLPSLLKLKQVLAQPTTCDLVDDVIRQDLVDRLEVIVEILVNCRLL
ncbi:Armadillo-type fold [Plasmopara halstedii]|uniref:Armadillo-type fold n=1 Tax=Plasmopara halstedii TaxID=4781 RepID=A0A0P1AYE7_PLAHL|nr:Armadillo-type fold [Plasmopara halstedii]CEG46604.1 Armadillo-type fold [Plasmopara halstedii]|eukprot:XP_024582973.1 Armadillo-type fold [Plasmopara halstedii]